MEEVKSGSKEIEIEERGEIFFFYRPKVGKEEVHGPQDVQRLYVVLRPEFGERSVEQKQDPHTRKEAGSTSRDEGGHGTQLEVNPEKEALLRLLVMGRKSLPDPTKRTPPYWCFVDMVTTNIDDLKNALGQQEYDTRTRGHRQVYPARAVGEGVYRILRHRQPGGNRVHTHLVYKLELPLQHNQNEPQESLNIEPQASFLIQIKNPLTAASSDFRGLGSKRKATFPAHLQGLFGQKRYSPCDPPDFLNYEGCELLLISASDDIQEELGLEVKTEDHIDPSSSDLARTFGEALPTRPLIQGTWV